MSIAIIGNGGMGREVKSYFNKIGIESIFFVSDEFYKPNSNLMKLSDLDIDKHHVLVCIANPSARKQIVNNLPNETRYFTFIHPSAQVYTEHMIGEGSIICPNVVVSCNVKIESHVIINYNSTIGHDTHIGNYSTINPNSSVSGNCLLEDNVFIGAGTSIKEKTKIVSDVIVGMGTVVVKDIVNTGTYVGVPSRKL